MADILSYDQLIQTPEWQEATPEQQKAFLDQEYTNRFNKYNNEITVSPEWEQATQEQREAFRNDYFGGLGENGAKIIDDQVNIAPIGYDGSKPIEGRVNKTVDLLTGVGNLANAAGQSASGVASTLTNPNFYSQLGDQMGGAIQKEYSTAQNNPALYFASTPLALGVGATKGTVNLLEGLVNLATADIPNAYMGRNAYQTQYPITDFVNNIANNNQDVKGALDLINTISNKRPVTQFIGEQLPFLIPIGGQAAASVKGGSKLAELAKAAATAGAYGASFEPGKEVPQDQRGVSRLTNAAIGAAIPTVLHGAVNLKNIKIGRDSAPIGLGQLPKINRTLSEIYADVVTRQDSRKLNKQIVKNRRIKQAENKATYKSIGAKLTENIDKPNKQQKVTELRIKNKVRESVNKTESQKIKERMIREQQIPNGRPVPKSESEMIKQRLKDESTSKRLTANKGNEAESKVSQTLKGSIKKSEPAPKSQSEMIKERLTKEQQKPDTKPAPKSQSEALKHEIEQFKNIGKPKEGKQDAKMQGSKKGKKVEYKKTKSIFYKILELPIDASFQEIKSSFRKKAIELHPDQNKASDANEIFKDLYKEYEQALNNLKQSEKSKEARAKYEAEQKKAQEDYKKWSDLRAKKREQWKNAGEVFLPYKKGLYKRLNDGTWINQNGNKPRSKDVINELNKKWEEYQSDQKNTLDPKGKKAAKSNKGIYKSSRGGFGVQPENRFEYLKSIGNDIKSFIGKDSPLSTETKQLVKDRYSNTRAALYNVYKHLYHFDKSLIREVQDLNSTRGFKTNKEELKAILPFIREGQGFPSKLGRKYPELERLYRSLSRQEITHLERIADDAYRPIDRLWQQYKQLHGYTNFNDIHNHITHIWDIPKNKRGAIGDAFFATKSNIGKKRTISSLYEGIEHLDLTAKVLDFNDILKIEADSLINAIENKKFLNQLDSMTLPNGEKVVYKPQDANAPRSYIQIGKWDNTRLVHPEIERPMNVVFGGRFNSPWFKAVETINSVLKKLSLSLSLFHHIALTESGLVTPGIGIKGVAKVTTKRNINNVAFEDFAHIAEDGIKHGLVIGASHDVGRGTVQDIFSSLERNSRGIPILGKAATLLKKGNEMWDTALWDYMHDSYKLMGYENILSMELAKPENANLTISELKDLKTGIAQIMNDTFGGQPWERFMITPKERQVMQLSLLSPDWLTSTIRHGLMTTGFGKVTKAKAEVNLRRRVGAQYWLGAAAFTLLGINALNATFRKYDMANNPKYYQDKEYKAQDMTIFGNAAGHQTHLFLGRYPDGTEIYVRWGKQFREIPEYFFDMANYGEFSPATTTVGRLSSKSSPIIRMTGDFVKTMKGEDPYMLPEEKRSGWTRTISAIKKMSSEVLPFSFRQQEDKPFIITDIAMPSSKGMSKYKLTELYKRAILNSDYRLIHELTIDGYQNNIDALENLKTAITSLKSEDTKNLKKLLEKTQYSETDPTKFGRKNTNSVNVKINKIVKEQMAKEKQLDSRINNMQSTLKILDSYINKLEKDGYLGFKAGRQKSNRIKVSESW